MSKKNIYNIKEKVAIEFGVTIDMPTKWDYAMMLFRRTKTQINMYERVIEVINKK